MDNSTTSHKPVIFTPNNIQHIHMMTNQTLEWHLLYFLHITYVHTHTPKQTATDCIVALTPVQWLKTSTPYLLTPWNRVLLEKLTSKLCSLSSNSLYLWNPKVPHRTHKCPPPVPLLSQLHPIPTTPSNFMKTEWYFLLTDSMEQSPSWEANQ
jgi:hypothetical protein